MRHPPRISALCMNGGRPGNNNNNNAQQPIRRTAVTLAQARSLLRRALPPLSQVVEDSDVFVQRITDNNIKARCPFHKNGMEQNPSMTINDNEGVYYCFTCQEGGDAIKFVEQFEELSTSEAIAELAERYDVDGLDAASLVTGGGGGGGGGIMGQSRPLEPHEQALVDANEAAARFYLLARRTPAAKECARLLKERGVTNAIAERFGLGFASDKWDGLALHLRTSTAVSVEASVAAGLCKASANRPGAVSDLFRERLIIPIHNPAGRVVALGGRTIRDKDAAAAGAAAADTPKYINSPESAVFKKGKLLYGMHLAQREIRRAKRALVVEGYMDVIAMHAAGLPYAVACLGTAVSEEQIELAASPIGVAPTAAGEAANGASAAAAPAARTVVLALDGDDAGQQAVMRLYESGALSSLLAKGVDVRVADLSPTPFKDPDEFLQAARRSKAVQPLYARDPAGAMAAAGADFERQVIDTAAPWVEWVGMRHIAPLAANPTTAEYRAVFDRLVGVLRKVPLPAERALHVRTLSGALARAYEADGDAPNATAAFAQRISRDLDQILAAADGAPSAATASPRGSGDVAGGMARHAGAQLPAAALAQLNVSLSDLYVWDGAPMKLHWSKGSVCDMALNKPRPPHVTELGLGLCEVCMRRSAAGGEAAPPTTPATSPNRNAATERAAAAGGGAAAAAPPSAAPKTASQLMQAGTREQAEIVLLHVLFRLPALRETAARMCDARNLSYGRTGWRGGGGATEASGAAVLGTPERRLFIGLLLGDAASRGLNPRALWDLFEVEKKDGGGAAELTDALLPRIRRAGDDDLNYLTRRWLGDAPPDAARDDAELVIERCIDYIVRDDASAALVAKAQDARAGADAVVGRAGELRRALHGRGSTQAATSRDQVAEAVERLATLSEELTREAARLADKALGEEGADGGRGEPR